jgi:hypothetical protein
MRYATTPAWVNIMLIVMGLAFAVAGLILLVSGPQPVGAIVGGIWLALGAGVVLFALRALQGRKNDDRIRREGNAATATVLDAQTTGLIVNNVPQWKLQLRIDGAGASYETTLKIMTYSPPMTGAALGVRIDPQRREHVVLAGDQTAAGGDPAALIRSALAGRSGGQDAQVQAAIESTLRQTGLADGESAVANPDGSRTITMTSTTLEADDDVAKEGVAAHDPAETIRLLDDLERMRASGALGQSEFDALKQRLLGKA